LCRYSEAYRNNTSKYFIDTKFAAFTEVGALLNSYGGVGALFTALFLQSKHQMTTASMVRVTKSDTRE
jgi:hypothetical protein